MVAVIRPGVILLKLRCSQFGTASRAKHQGPPPQRIDPNPSTTRKSLTQFEGASLGRSVGKPKRRGGGMFFWVFVASISIRLPRVWLPQVSPAAFSRTSFGLIQRGPLSFWHCRCHRCKHGAPFRASLLLFIFELVLPFLSWVLREAKRITAVVGPNPTMTHPS